MQGAGGVVILAFGVGAGVVGEGLVVFAGFDFGDQFGAQGLGVAVLFGGEAGQGEIVAEGAGFYCRGEIPECGKVRIGEAQAVETQSRLIGKLEESLFVTTAGDDGLGGEVVVGGGGGFAFGRLDHGFDVIFGEGAEVEVGGYFFYGGVGECAFDGADGDVAGTGGMERGDANFADSYTFLFGTNFQDVIYPFWIGVEAGLGYYVEIFQGRFGFGVIGRGE